MLAKFHLDIHTKNVLLSHSFQEQEIRPKGIPSALHTGQSLPLSIQNSQTYRPQGVVMQSG